MDEPSGTVPSDEPMGLAVPRQPAPVPSGGGAPAGGPTGGHRAGAGQVVADVLGAGPWPEGRRNVAAASLADPWQATAGLLQVTTTGNVVYCGQGLTAPEGMVAVRAGTSGRAQVPLAEVVHVEAVGSCGQ
jgi:hypothetical protein